MEVDLQLFGKIQESMDAESNLKDEIRQVVREFDRTCRNLAFAWREVHFCQPSEVPKICERATDQFHDVREHIQKLAKLIPAKQHYRYNDLWSRTLQQACFLAAWNIYLQYERLITVQELEEIMGVKVNLDNTLDEFHISVEDYLLSVILLVNELARFAVNSVTIGDYQRPIRISNFVRTLSSGFQLLNLKNDILRKRFDSIKYDVKTIEGIVYDVTLRGLVKPENPAA
ncbi:uncharacterized protein VTP21DRAFT_9823 [Calcarisporiella thermophila]|uniref:uncharacterized protein n=1 Tax=Calcarisporiella thermophila TaxID=911321 RepID=UPI003742CB7E